MMLRKKMNKKGEVENLKMYFAIFLSIVVVGYVFFILSDSLKDTLATTDCEDSGGYWNADSNTCQNSSSNTTAISYTKSTGLNSTENIETGMLNATKQLPQAGTLIGIGVILGVIGLAVYGARRYGLF